MGTEPVFEARSANCLFGYATFYIQMLFKLKGPRSWYKIMGIIFSFSVKAEIQFTINK